MAHRSEPARRRRPPLCAWPGRSWAAGTGAGGRVDLDGARVANLHRIYEQLRRDHPHVLIDACAGGGARTDLAMAARADIFWPSDNTGPLDRLAIQYGYLHANAPHLLSSWVTDSPGLSTRACGSVYRHGEQRYSGSHLTAVGLPAQWTAEHDAELVVLRRA
ncbi:MULTISPECIES: alpha-galactosidase [Streptomyces]|nr:alpha-galactosidase [Streptomyces sp. HG99]PIB08562.1 hypothetical protein B1C81_13295 [Streptomyces sp. HG99]